MYSYHTSAFYYLGLHTEYGAFSYMNIIVYMAMHILYVVRWGKR